MNRELKFRAWNHRNEDWETNSFDADLDEERIGTPSLLLINTMYHKNNGDLYTFQLATGLIDSDGVEIFEGDIVEYTKHDGYLMDSFKGEIRFIQSYACFGYLKLGLNKYGFDHVVIHPFSEHDEFEIDVLPYFKIVGNIFDNSEIINEADETVA